mmetsp:Transcript_9353/g.21257  ORF Transcript_9353/g.21257 Transcript_9353/m.21257 type:complete len:265 (+) Transcript_9353:60-854(+)
MYTRPPSVQHRVFAAVAEGELSLLQARTHIAAAWALRGHRGCRLSGEDHVAVRVDAAAGAAPALGHAADEQDPPSLQVNEEVVEGHQRVVRGPEAARHGLEGEDLRAAKVDGLRHHLPELPEKTDMHAVDHVGEAVVYGVDDGVLVGAPFEVVGGEVGAVVVHEEQRHQRPEVSQEYLRGVCGEGSQRRVRQAARGPSLQVELLVLREAAPRACEELEPALDDAVPGVDGLQHGAQLRKLRVVNEGPGPSLAGLTRDGGGRSNG